MMRSLPLASWPFTLNAAWLEACRPGRLRRAGRAAHLGPVAQDDYVRHLGYLLQFLQDQGRLATDAGLGDQLTPEVIEAYLARARLSWSSVTLYHNLSKLRRAAEFIDPRLDFSWLKPIEADLRAVMQPRDRSDRLVMSDRLVKAGLELAEQAEK